MSIVGIDPISVEVTRKAARKWADLAQKLGNQVPVDAEKVMREGTRQALVGIYGPSLGAPDAWMLSWSIPSGTLGLFTVSSDDPHVKGYEFGTAEHIIVANQAPVLYFWWQKKGAFFLGEAVLHPGTKGHHRVPYLVTYLRELAYYGWSSAVAAAIGDAPYAGIKPGIPRIFVPAADDPANNVGSDNTIYGGTLAGRLQSQDHFRNVFQEQMRRRRRGG